MFICGVGHLYTAKSFVNKITPYKMTGFKKLFNFTEYYEIRK